MSRSANLATHVCKGSKCEELKVSTMSRLYPRKLTCERTSVDFAFVPFADVAGIPVDARNFVLFV